MVSTLRGFFSASDCFKSRAHSHSLVLHNLQTTPPMSLINYVPSRAKPSASSFKIPTSLAIALAVIKLSPVTILTLIPAL